MLVLHSIVERIAQGENRATMKTPSPAKTKMKRKDEVLPAIDSPWTRLQLPN